MSPTRFKDSVARWHQQHRHTQLDPRGKSRPPWVKPSNRGDRATGYHLFARGRSKADLWSGTVLREWQSLDGIVKLSWTTRARQQRKISQSKSNPLECYLDAVEAVEDQAGPWQLSSSTGKFALHLAVVNNFMCKRTLLQAGREWMAKLSGVVSGDPDFPPEQPFDGPFEFIPADIEPVVITMLDTLRLAM